MAKVRGDVAKIAMVGSRGGCRFLVHQHRGVGAIGKMGGGGRFGLDGSVVSTGHVFLPQHHIPGIGDLYSVSLARCSRSQLPVMRWDTEMKQTTHTIANHAKGPTACFLSHSECSGSAVVSQPRYSKPIQAYARQTKPCPATPRLRIGLRHRIVVPSPLVPFPDPNPAEPRPNRTKPE